MSVSTARDDVSGNRASASAAPAEQVARDRPRLWPAVLILALFWTFVFVARQMELITFVRFMSSMAASGLVVLAYAIWWLANKRISRKSRLLGVAVTVAGGIAAGVVCDKSYGAAGLVMFTL